MAIDMNWRLAGVAGDQRATVVASFCSAILTKIDAPCFFFFFLDCGCRTVA
jgi:hypothetical protein